MAVAQMVLGLAVLPMETTDRQTEGESQGGLLEGVESFFTTERIRDIVIVSLAAFLYYLLARHAKNRMIIRPSRVAVEQDLRSYIRLGVDHPDLAPLANKMESTTKSPPLEEELVMRGLALRRDLAFAARLKELEDLDSDGLRAVAAPVKGALHPPIASYIDAASLDAPKCDALRQALAGVSRDNAEKFWIANRKVLRRRRKAQAIGLSGLLLIVLLVSLFGNPALVAFGVLGAVVSRTIAFFRTSSDDYEKLNWVVLFLVPVVGALSAYGGVLLIDASLTWGLLGETFEKVNFGGASANVPTMAAAFLFGFVERLLDNVVDKAAPDGLAAVASQEETEKEDAERKAAEKEKSGKDESTGSKTTVEILVKHIQGGEVPDDEEKPPGTGEVEDGKSPTGGGGASTNPPITRTTEPAKGASPTLPELLHQMSEPGGGAQGVLHALVNLVDRFAGTPPPPTPGDARLGGQPSDPDDSSQPHSGDAEPYEAGVRAGTFLAGLIDGLRGRPRP